MMDVDQSTGPFVVPNQRNLARFLTDSNLPQIVCIHVKHSKFLVNSVILSLHSSVFEKQILELSSENYTLFLDECLLSIEDIESIVRDCLEYIHGEKIRLTYSNVRNFCKFATVYKICPLITSCKSFIDEHLGDLTIQELLENYGDVDKAFNHNYIKKNCRRIIGELLSEEGSHIIPGLKENVEFLKFLVDCSSSESCGKLLVLLVKTETFDSSLLLDFPLDKLNYIELFPIFEDFQEFIKLLIMSVKDPVIIEHKVALKRLCLVSRILGNTIELKAELTSDLQIAEDSFTDRCPDGPQAVVSITNGASNTNLNEPLLNDSINLRGSPEIKWKPESKAGTHMSSQYTIPARTEMSQSSIFMSNSLESSCSTDDSIKSRFESQGPPLSTESRPRDDVTLLEKCIEIDHNVKRNRLGDYYRVELFLGWVLNRQFKLNVAAYDTFLKSFDFRRLNRIFFEDAWSLCSLFYEPFSKMKYCEYVDIDELSDDNNFFVIQRKVSQAHIRKSIMSSGNILLPGNSPCLLNKCDERNHMIGQISIKLRVSLDDQSHGLVRKNQHQKSLEHYYMTLLDKDMKFSGLVSLKILTRTDISSIVMHYDYFCITLVYKN